MAVSCNQSELGLAVGKHQNLTNKRQNLGYSQLVHSNIEAFLLVLAFKQALQASKLLLQLLADFVCVTLPIP